MFWGPYATMYWFYISLLVILLFDKEKLRKLTYAGYSSMVLLALYNPLVFYLCRRVFGDSIAYFSRLYSLLPVPFLIAYAAVFLLGKTTGIMKPVLFLFIEGMILLGGHNIYSEDWIRYAENPTKLSDEVLQICDMVHDYKAHVCIAAPENLATYIRQYDGSILMPYARNTQYHPMRDLLNEDVPDIEAVLSRAGENACDYVVVKKNANNYINFEEQGQILAGETEHYLLYLLCNIPRIKRQYNNYCQIIEERNLNADNQLVLNGSDYAIVKYEYDAEGNCCKTLYYDTNEIPILTKMGYYGISRRYNKRHLVEEEFYLDSTGQPFTASFGYASVRYKYDRNGRRCEEYYFDATGNPTMLSSGQYGLRREYRSNDLVSRIMYLDSDGNPVLLKSGYAMIDRDYDNAGNLIAEYYFDKNGMPVVLGSGHSGYQRTFNERKQVTTLTYVDASHRPMVISAGYSTIKYIYDSSGNLVEEYYYDLDDAPVSLSTGEYGCRKVFNNQKQATRIMYIDAHGTPLMRTDGYCGFEQEYNELGQIIGVYYFGIDESPIALSSGQYGFQQTYNEKGLVRSLTYVDKNHFPMEIGEPKYCRIEYQYDENRQITNISYYNLTGDLVREDRK